MDENFIITKISLTPDYEGEVIATFIESKKNIGGRKSMLYIHGYVDYFFNEELSDKFINAGYDFYAIDLRKYGRSLLDHQKANYCESIDEYFEDLDKALILISEKTKDSIYLLGHSTGGLIASCYLNRGNKRSRVAGLILNSPFLDFNQSPTVQKIAQVAFKVVTSVAPNASINGVLSSLYVQSIHTEFNGEWYFNLSWRPVHGFPTYLKWIMAISNAHKSLKSSNIKVPILLMHSSNFAEPKFFSEEATHADIVLDVNKIKQKGVLLGDKVHIAEIENAMHDIFLSAKDVREKAYIGLFEWLNIN